MANRISAQSPRPTLRPAGPTAPPTREQAPQATRSTPASTFESGDKTPWAVKKAAFERAFASGDPKRLADALAGPDAFIARDAVHALLARKPREAKDALVQALLDAPQVWNHVDVNLLERFGSSQQRTQVLDRQLAVATQKDAPSWAVYGTAKAAAAGNARALEVMRTLGEAGRADAKAAAAQSADERAKEDPAGAVRLLAAAGLPLTRAVAQGVGEAASAGRAPPSDVADALANLAARGDERALELVSRFADKSWGQGAVRDAFRLGGTQVKERLAPLVRFWNTSADLEGVVAGARAGAKGAIDSLASRLDVLERGPQQEAPIAALRERVEQGDVNAIRAVLGLRLNGLTSPEVIELVTGAARRAPAADARGVLDQLGGALSASFRPTSELPRLLESFGRLSERMPANASDLQALRIATQRLSGAAENPAAALLGRALASRGAALSASDVKGTAGSELDLAGLMDMVRARGTAASRPELSALASALERFVPSRDMAQLGDAREAARLVADAAISQQDALVLGGPLGREAVFPLLTDAQKVGVGALASRSADLRADLRSWLPAAPETARLSALATKFESALADAIAKAPAGSPLNQLGELVKAQALARTDAFKDRIDMNVVNTRLSTLLASPATQSALQDVRNSVVTQSPDRQRVAAQADYLASASYQARLAALPPEQAVAEFQRDVLALKALAPEQVSRVANAQRALAVQGLAQQLQTAPVEDRPGLELLLTELNGAAGTVTERALEAASKRSGPGLQALRAVLFGVDLATAASQLDGLNADTLAGVAKLGEAMTWGANVVSRGALETVATRAANLAAGIDLAIDGYGAMVDAFDGDLVGAAGKGVSAGAAGTLLFLAAGGPVSWAAVMACTGIGLGGKLLDGYFGESETETRLRQQGLLKPSPTGNGGGL